MNGFNQQAFRRIVWDDRRARFTTGKHCCAGIQTESTGLFFCAVALEAVLGEERPNFCFKKLQSLLIVRGWIASANRGAEAEEK